MFSDLILNAFKCSLILNYYQKVHDLNWEVKTNILKVCKENWGSSNFLYKNVYFLIKQTNKNFHCTVTNQPAFLNLFSHQPLLWNLEIGSKAQLLENRWLCECLWCGPMHEAHIPNACLPPCRQCMRLWPVDPKKGLLFYHIHCRKTSQAS